MAQTSQHNRAVW